MAEITLRPRFNSSFIRSKISTLVSTAIPTVSTKPAMPGKCQYSVPGNNDINPSKLTKFNAKAMR